MSCHPLCQYVLHIIRLGLGTGATRKVPPKACSRHLVCVSLLLLDLREVRRVVGARDEGHAVPQHHLRDGAVVEPVIGVGE